MKISNWETLNFFPLVSVLSIPYRTSVLAIRILNEQEY